MAIAKFARFISMPGAGELLVDADLEDDLVVQDVAAGWHQDQSEEDVDDAGRDVGLVQPGRPCAHREYRHEAEVERLDEGPGVKLGEDGGAAADVAEDQHDDDHQGTNHIGPGCRSWVLGMTCTCKC